MAQNPSLILMDEMPSYFRATSIELPVGILYSLLQYLPSRPTGFPQIVADTHNPRTPCFECHEPHDPKPPETPQNCSACHATIARTKLVSHHANVDCIVCHETSEGHKIDPRDFIPPKPTTRAFCGSCHGEDADSSPRIPRVDMDSHGTGYVCWQCHYPHLPETQ